MIKELIPGITIAVDGYSATGKSTFAKLVAKEFGFLYLDSGAMYRGVTLYALENGFVAADGSVDAEGLVASLVNIQDLHFESEGERTVLYMGSRRIESEIRTMKVSSSVSPVSVIPQVRAWVDERLHAMSTAGRVIMDGRDIGTTVFPNAELKIFMVASDDVRAKRRYDEMLASGTETTIEEVLNNLHSRDYIDSHRETSPLRKADDAYVLDNSDMTLHEEIVWLTGLFQGKFHILG